MPLLPNGNFIFWDSLRTRIDVDRRIASMVLRQAKEQGVTGKPVDDAQEKIRKADELERIYFDELG